MATKRLKSITFPGLPDTYTIPEVDDTLSQTGEAADAKATGDEISNLNNHLNDIDIGIYGGDFDKTYDNHYLTISGSVIITNNGQTTGNNPNWAHSDYIFINSSDETRYIYLTNRFASGGGWGLAFYNSYKSFISGIGYDNDTDAQFEIPENAAYFRFSSNNMSVNTECRIVSHIGPENSDVGEIVKSIAQPLDSFNVYVDNPHTFTYTETLQNVDDKPFTVTRQSNINTLVSSISGFIPVLPGAKYRASFSGNQNMADSNYRGRIKIVGLLDGASMRYIAENNSIPLVDRTAPIDDRLGGPWCMNLGNAVFSDDYSTGYLDFEIPKTLDASDGLYLVWLVYFNFIAEANLNTVIVELEDYKMPNTKSALSVPYSLGGLSNIIGYDPQAIVYGLGDSTNSDDVSRNIANHYHFSPTKVIAQKMKASKYVNYSVPGTTISSMYASSQNVGDDATVVVIITGINDINRQTFPLGDIDEILAIENADNIPENTMLGIYCKAVRKLRARLADNAQIFCVSPFYYVSRDIPEAIANFREGLRKMCYTLGSFKGYRFIDGCNVGITPENWCMLCRDTVHPMMEGQTVIANHILDHITPPAIAGEQFNVVQESGIPLKPTYIPITSE